MDEYIDRAVAVSQANFIHGRWDDVYVSAATLMAMPAADVAPVRNARWKRYGKNLGECSECGEIVSVRSNYCPNCGAKMDGGADNG